MDTCIKNVSETAWKAFKLEAVRRGMNMGSLFNKLVEENLERNSQTKWEKVLTGGPRLTAASAKKLRKDIAVFRKGFDFR